MLRRKAFFPFLFIFTSLHLFIFASCFAQQFSEAEQRQLDSLNAIINNPQSHDTSLAGAYVELSNILYVSNLDTMIPLCTKAKDIAEKALKNLKSEIINRKLKKALAGSYNNIGYMHIMRGEIPEALEYYGKAKLILEESGDKAGLATYYNSVGFIHQNQGDIPLALEYYHKALKIQEEIKDKQGMAQSYHNIGTIYDNQGDIPLALEYYHKALKIQEELKDKQQNLKTQ